MKVTLIAPNQIRPLGIFWTFCNRIRIWMVLKRYALLGVLLLFNAYAALAQNAVPPGTIPVPIPNPRPTGATNGFAIDGDLKAYGDVAPYLDGGDWLPNPLTAAGYGGVLTATGSVPTGADPNRVIHKIDSYGSTDDIFGGGSKIDSNPNSVTWKTGGPNPSKNDINHALVYIAEATSATGANNGTLAGDTWVMMAGDRATKEGNSFLAFQFLQKSLTRNANGTFTSAGLQGGRTVGDIQITAEFVNGGTVPNLYYEEWRAVGTAYDWVSLAVPPGGVAYGSTNGAVLTNVPYSPFGGSSYDTNLFAEIGVDISAVYRSVATTCVGKISTLWVVTKSSQSSSANMTDFVEPIPLDLRINVTADAGLDRAICAGGSTTLGPLGTPDVTNYDYSWSINGGTAFSTSPQPSVSPSATTTYTLTVTKKGSTCSSSDDVVVTVNANPTASAGTAPAAQCRIVAGNSFNLSGSGANGSPSWAVQANPNNLTVSLASSSTFAPTVTVSGGSGTVTLRLTVTSTVTPSCGAQTSDVTVTVNPNPTADAGTAPAAQCYSAALGNSFNLSGTATNGSPSWAVQSSTNGLSAIITNGTTLTPAVAVSGGSGTVTLRLTVTSAYACTAATSDVTVTVNANPTASAGATPAAQCLVSTGNTFSLDGSGTNGSYKWTVASKSSPTLSASFSSDVVAKPTVTITGGVSGTVTLRLTVTSTATPSCGSQYSDVTVTVNPNPTANAGTAPAAQCYNENGNSFNLSGTASNGSPSWAVQTNASGLSVIITNGSTLTPGVAVSGGSGTVTLRLTVTSGYTPACTAATSDVTVTVNAKPAGPTVTIQESSLCSLLTSPTLTVCNPVVGTTYVVTETDGSNPQSITYASGVLKFTMREGKGFSITATSSAASGGCVSAATVCGGQSATCPSPPALMAPTTAVAPVSALKTIQTEAYPNPTSRDATINFVVPTTGHVVVQVYNSLGMPVATLFDGQATAGELRSVVLKGQNLATGTYTYRVIANGKTKTNRISLIK